MQRKKKIILFISILCLILLIVDYLYIKFNSKEIQQSIELADKQEINHDESYKSIESQKIRITTNNTEVIVILNESKAAADLVEMLPLELTLIERNNFAKGMTIPKQLSSYEKTTREYEIGDFGYWNAGPDLAIFYDDIYEQTIVEVIPLGHAESGAETLANETGKVKLELITNEN